MKRPLLIPIIFFLLGILLSGMPFSPVSSGHIPLIIAAIVLVILLLTVSVKSDKVFYSILCLFFLLLGAFRYTSAVTPAESDIAKFVSTDPKEVAVYGTVTNDPEWKGASYAPYQKFSFEVEKLLAGGDERSVTGSALVNLFSEINLPEVGDKLVISGRVSAPQGQTNPAGFDYRSYLDRNGIRAILYSRKGDYYLKTGVSATPVITVQRYLFSLQEKASGAIDKYLSGSAKAITASIILGQRSGITSEVEDVFIKTGTMHILAVSGLHVGIVALILAGFLRLIRLPRNFAYFLTIIGICAFAVFAGARPSSIRAAIMGSFVLMGLMLGRKSDVLNALALSALLILFFQPGQLFQAGFILSYMAVLSIIFITPLTDALFGVTPKNYILKFVSLSLAVWIGMIPVIAAYFRIITPVVFLANLVAVPVLSVMIVLGFCLFFPFASFISAGQNALVEFFLKVMELFSRVPGAFVRVPAPNGFLIEAYFAALAIVIILFRRKKEYRKIILIFLIFAANLFLWSEVFLKPPDAFRTTFFDVAKADASILEFTDGSVMMIDGGSKGEWTGRDAGRDVLAPYLWQKGIRTIDCVLLTHDHEDHIGGLLYILKNFNVRAVIDGGGVVKHGYDFEKALYKEFIDIVKKKNIPRLKVNRGDIIDGLPDAKFYCFNPPQYSYGDANNDSIVVKAVTEKDNTIIFCADAGSKAMEEMLLFGSLLKSDIMKVPHHGGRLGDLWTAKEFFREVDAEYAIIQTTRVYAREDILKTFRQMGVKTYTTYASGAIICEETEEGFACTGFKR